MNYYRVVEIEFAPSTDIHNACSQAIILATEEDVCVKFTFNDKNLRAYNFSSVEDLVEEYFDSKEQKDRYYENRKV